MMRSKITALCAAVVVTSVAIAAAQVPEALRGTWVLTSAEGKPLPPGVHVSLVIAENGYHGTANGKINERGTMKVDSSTRPMSIDLMVSEGTSAGKTQLGIVEVTGDAMQLALAEPGSTVRPNTLSGGLSVTRVKPLPKELAGAWEATITVGATTQHVALTLSNGPDGLGTGTIGAATPGAATVPVTCVLQVGQTFRVIIPAAKATFEGTLTAGEFQGTWNQGNQSVPAVFKRR